MSTETWQPDLARVRAAWQTASDDDLLRALNHREDYHPDAFAVLAGEAAHRGLDAADWQPPPTAARRLLEVLARRRPWVRVVVAVVLGGSVPVLMRLLVVYWPVVVGSAATVVPMGVWMAVAAALCCAAVACSSWPLRRVRPVIIAVVACWVTNVVVACFMVTHVQGVTVYALPSLRRALGIARNFAVLWIVPLVLLTIVVRFHNHYRPIYPAGFCQNCGYSLRGLTSPRCPECATTFEEPSPPATEA